MLNMMLVTRLLSSKATNSLGYFEIQFGHDPIATRALENFRQELKKVGETIDNRNEFRVRKYPYLHPLEIPNAISI